MTGHESLPSQQSIPELRTPRFQVEFEYFWNQLSDGMEYLVSAEELAALKENTLQKETEFYNKIFPIVDKAVGTSSPTVCLFDVDGTLGEIKDEVSAELHTLLRPSATQLITGLAVRHPEYLRFGLLSNRPQASLDNEVENPTFLGPIRPFMDSKLIFSSEMEERSDPLWLEEYTDSYMHRALSSLRGIVDRELISDTLSGKVDLRQWYDPKIKLIAQFIKFNLNVNVIYVDNLPSASVFDPSNSRIKGINVCEQRPLLIPGL